MNTRQRVLSVMSFDEDNEIFDSSKLQKYVESMSPDAIGRLIQQADEIVPKMKKEDIQHLNTVEHEVY